MLTLMVGETEVYDDVTNEFSYSGGIRVDFEHSLVSLSKWESQYEKPFLNGESRTSEEMLFYIRCMILSPEVSSDIVNQLSEENLNEISQYIEAKRSATTFVETPTRAREEVITSELIYYWMVAFQIPISCETWHLNRLLTLIRVCSIKNQPAQKLSKSDLARRNRELNAQRRAKLGTEG